MPDSNAARQARLRRRRKLAEEEAGAPRDAYGYLLTDFWKAFPARPNDLAPSAAQLKRLGETMAR